MTAAHTLVGKTMLHPLFKKVKIMGVVPGTRTQVQFKVVQRARGWNPDTQSYDKVKTVYPQDHGGNSIQWKRYSDSYSSYGLVGEIHIEKLKAIN